MQLLLIDDHPIVFDAMRLILKRLPGDISSEQMTRLGDGIARTLAGPRPDLVLLDLGLPGQSGISSLLNFRLACPEVRVAVISATQDRTTIDKCLRLGAAGFIPKSYGASQLRNALQSLLSGKIFDPAGGTPAPVTNEYATVATTFGLTSRQMDVLKLMARGMSNVAIGNELGLATNTVKVHVAALLDRLSAGNRTEAVTIARHAGLPFD